MIRLYLSNHQVVSKNKQEQTFAISIRVFVDLQQTPVINDGAQLSHSTFDELHQRFENVCARYTFLKEQRRLEGMR